MVNKQTKRSAYEIFFLLRLNQALKDNKSIVINIYLILSIISVFYFDSISSAVIQSFDSIFSYSFGCYCSNF